MLYGTKPRAYTGDRTCHIFYKKGGFGYKVIATFTRAMSSINLLFVFVKVKVKKVL